MAPDRPVLFFRQNRSARGVAWAAVPLFAVLLAGVDTCGGTSSPPPLEPSCQSEATDSPLDIVVPVPLNGPYGSRTFRVPARTNWVNSGVYLRVGETAEITLDSGSWTYAPPPPDPDQEVRPCPLGSFVARIGLRYEDAALTCVGAEGATVTAASDGPLFVGMLAGTDLGEFYSSRALASGELIVTVTSDAGTVPVLRRDQIGCFDPGSIASGVFELAGEHISVLTTTAAFTRDAATAGAALDTLDAIYDAEHDLRQAVPYFGQRIRFVTDPAIDGIGYMLASNPIRMLPELESGEANHRILRAGEPSTDVWGFAHELGHTFTAVDGTWVYMHLNLESWPNIFTIYALAGLGRTSGQPNLDTYCDGRAQYFDVVQPYSVVRDDPLLQLCFLMEFREEYGWDVWRDFFAELNGLNNEDIPTATDEETWAFSRDLLSRAAGEDVTERFDRWRIPLPGGCAVLEAYASLDAGRLPSELATPWNLGGEGAVLEESALVVATGADHDSGYFYRETTQLVIPDEWTIRATVRVIAEHSSETSRAGAVVQFATGDAFGNVLQIGQDEVFLLAENLERGQVAGVDTDDAHHTYEIQVSRSANPFVKARPIRVYQDGVKILDGVTFDSDQANPGEPWIGFGDISTLASGTSSWLEFSHDAFKGSCGYMEEPPAE